MVNNRRSRTHRHALRGHEPGRSDRVARGLVTSLLAGLVGCATAAQGGLEDVVFAPELGVDLTGVDPLRPGLWVIEESPGVGEPARNGDELRVEYVGWLPDGKVFDSSVARREPLVFRLGANRVIDGWDVGLEGMRSGGVRRLIMTPRWGYGREGSTRVPPNTHLVFEVQLLRIERGELH